MRRRLMLVGALLLAFANGITAQDIGKNARNSLLNQRILRNAYVGICVYDPANGKYLYTHDPDRYFAPASNTKLFSLYTGLSYLGDSTTGIQYLIADDTLFIRGTGDPSFLHPDFGVQPAFAFLQNTTLPIVLVNPTDKNEKFGPGWSLGDYNRSYQPERSAFPIYGNVAWFTVKGHRLQVMPEWFARHRHLYRSTRLRTRSFYVYRNAKSNVFHYNLRVYNDAHVQQVPFVIDGGATTAALLADTLHKPVRYEPARELATDGWTNVRNVPLDSLFKHMMYRSDNFFAEQTDQMVSMKLFDTISTTRIIDFMLDGKLNDLPDKPKWVDGSGLSRYNQFTPRDMIAVLNKLYQEFPPARVDSLLPTGGKGTLSSLYHDMSGSIFAKTGSLRQVVSLSGYLITQKGKTLFFSILINHCLYPLPSARLAMQHFLHTIWENN